MKTKSMPVVVPGCFQYRSERPLSRAINTRKGIVAGRRMRTCASLAVLWALLIGARTGFAQRALFASFDEPSDSIWERGAGEGFRCGAQSFTLSAGASYGVQAIGSVDSHDLALGSLRYGRMLDNTMGAGHWYAGNFELQVQLFGGEQFSPSREWVVGLTPHLVYNFATGTRWVPFIDGGAGISGTSIRGPDLGGPFQFNLQAGVGVQRFLTDRMAVTLEASYLHLSSAGIYEPNNGVNTILGMVGVRVFF